MKKRILPLFLLLVLLLPGCRAVSPLTGLWQGEWTSEETGKTMNLCYRFTEDGQVLVESDGYSFPLGSYSTDGNVLVISDDDGRYSEFIFTVENDTLTLLLDGTVHSTFTRVK